MALIDQIEIAAVFVPSGVRDENTSGNVVLASELTGSGEEIPDVYTLTLSAVVAGVGTVTVVAGPNNPYNGRVTAGVPLDDVTEVLDVVPGVTLVFDSTGANSDTAEVTIGDPKGAIDASGAGAGVPVGATRHKVVNSGAADVADAAARLMTQAITVKKVGDVFTYVKPFAENATEKVSGIRVMPYEMIIDNVAGAGAGKTADLEIDGALFGADHIYDMTTGLTSNSNALKAIDPPYPYAVADGPLEGMIFALHPDCADDDSANVLIFPSRYVQIAPDVAGSPGTYDVADVPLTETGEAAGVITASGEAFYWFRAMVPESSNSESNPYPMNVALQASESSESGWEE